MVAGEFLRHGAQLQPVVGHLDGLAGAHVDAGPDRVAVFAAFLDVEDDGAGLADQLQAAFCPGDEIKVLLAGEVVFGEVRIDGQGIEIFAALRRLRLREPFMEGAVEVLGYGAAHVQHFDAVVVELVEQVCGELAAAAPLISLRDHGAILEYRRLTNG